MTIRAQAVYEPRSAESWRDPFTMYTALRDHDPVHYVSDGDYWVLSRFEHVFDAAIDAAAFSSAKGLTFTYGEMEELGLEAPIVMMDPPEHTTLRKLAIQRLTPRQVTVIEPMVRSFVVERVERLRELGEADVIAELLKPLPSLVVAHFLGVPQEDRTLFDRWTESIVAANADGDVIAADAIGELFGYFNGLIELRQAIAGWCERRFGLSFDPETEIAPLIGSKEGIGHIPLCFIDPGDVALVPDPGYPVYAVAVQFAGGEVHELPLLEEHGFLPDLEALPEELAARAKLLWLNYPNNPTAAIAGIDFFERAAAFAQRHEIAIVHDLAYSEIAYDGYRPTSFLQARGARDIGGVDGREEAVLGLGRGGGFGHGPGYSKLGGPRHDRRSGLAQGHRVRCPGPDPDIQHNLLEPPPPPRYTS